MKKINWPYFLSTHTINPMELLPPTKKPNSVNQSITSFFAKKRKLLSVAIGLVIFNYFFYIPFLFSNLFFLLFLFFYSLYKKRQFCLKSAFKNRNVVLYRLLVIASQIVNCTYKYPWKKIVIPVIAFFLSFFLPDGISYFYNSFYKSHLQHCRTWV